MQNGDYQAKISKQVMCKMWAETIRNFIYLVLAFFVLQPVIFVVLTVVFQAHVWDNAPVSMITVYTWKYTFYIYKILFGVSITLVVLMAVYFCLRECVIKEFKPQETRSESLTALIKRSIVSYPELYLLGATFLWITLAFFLKGNLKDTSGFGADRGRGYIYYLCYAILFVGFFATTRSQKKYLLEIYVATATIIAFLAIVFDAFGAKRIYAYSFVGAGIFTNRNYFGYFLAISVVLPAVRLYKTKNIYQQIYYGVCLVINEFALLLTLTRGAFLGAVAGIVIMLIYCPIQEKKFNYKLLIIPAILIVAYIVLELTGLTHFSGRIGLFIGDMSKVAEATSEEELDGVGSGRGAIWRELIRQIKSSPIIGVGIGHTIAPHNEFLQVAAWSGVPAAIFYIAGLVAVVYNAFKKRKEITDTQLAALVGAGAYVVSSFFGNGLLQTIPFYILVLALSFDISIELPTDKEAEAETIIGGASEPQKA